MNDNQVEHEIQAKGLTAPRVTPADIEAEIASEHYFTALDGVDGHYRGGPEAQSVENARALGLLTFCVLVLRNGFTITGESACVSPENFDPEIGRKIARQNAVNKVWPLLGFRLRDRLHDLANAPVSVCTCGPNEGCSLCPSSPALTLADSEADLAGTQRPDWPLKASN